MNGKELMEKIDKDLDEVFDVKNIVEFHFDLLQKAYSKGLMAGLKADEEYRSKTKEILQVILDKWKEERWILQSEKEVKQIENLMKQVEQFLKEIE